jgi:DNA polymerase IV
MPSEHQFIGSSPPAEGLAPDLSHLPPIYLISSRTPPGFTDDFGNSLKKCSAEVVDSADEATIFVGMVNTAKRAQFELRHLGIWTEVVPSEPIVSKANPRKRVREADEKGPRKSARRTSSATISGSDTEGEQPEVTPKATIESLPWNIGKSSTATKIFVIKFPWLQQSLAEDRLLSPSDFLVLEAVKIANPADESKSFDLGRVDSALTESVIPASHATTQDATDDILQRARADTPPGNAGQASRFVSAPYGRRRFRDQVHSSKSGVYGERPKLLDLKTSSQDDQGDHDLPAPPDWVREGKKFACERPTLEHSPNEDFVKLLEKIRLARLLTGDEVGVRAYSTSIASIASVQTKFINPKEILRLPGCDVKVANLWIEYKNTGTLAAADEVDTEETLQILKSFYDIWGVGEKTARDFYYDKGWRDRDDILEYGWQGLTRVQQIGLKYYDDFQLGIPRHEVEFILEKVKEHAIKVRDDGIEAIVVGGYRRGKAESGDVDVIISHRDLHKTANLVTDIVASLEEEGWITHTLSLHLTATKRGQATLPYKSRDKLPGTGFDTLDKALVVWQDINWPTKKKDLRQNPNTKNPNVHRRVDIIISPWRTVGCAVLGWSGGNTFQRDIRRYSKYEKEWKFDSSGIRSRRTGEVIELEGPNGVSGSMVDAEKSVFAGLDLEYREPYERWTR